MNLNQVTVPSLDLEKATAFYDLLGLRLIVKAMPHYVRYECPDGDATFSIHLVEQLPQGNGVAVYFETQQLDQEVRRLQEAGIDFDLLPTNQSWLWREARLKDPDGNQIILYFASDNRKNPPWRLDAGN
ncbi:MAG: VOC family protein [Dokdonia sp.]|mgnify:CR=1 FL=1|jgi:catechol 2,3-dioxygenase-like lactoylglutathione lyase family enzyme